MLKKTFKSPDYNYVFDLKTGFFARWGKTKDDDPEMSPYGPEIADIEVSTICNGITGIPCPWCYKSNTGVGENMSIETFKTVFSKFPPTLTQIAFGVGDIDANPDLWAMFEHCRKKQVIPNLTINGARLTDEIVEKLVSLTGAIAVSRYSPDDVCYNAVKRLTDAGHEQINIHQLLSHETVDGCMKVLKDRLSDPRLEKLKSIVFLTLKQKGERNTLTPVNREDYVKIVKFAEDNKIGIGFDSCGATMFSEATGGKYDVFVEPCESYLFSIYVNTQGLSYPCSFLEDQWEGIDMTKVTDFEKEVWNCETTQKWRQKLLECKRSCPAYKNLIHG